MADFLRRPDSPRRRLRELLDKREPVLAPGCHDALSARMVELAGFDAVYMGGFASTASLLGRPDVGLLSGTEMIENARRIVQAVDIPVVADADTGYGNAINVIRTVHDYEQAGVAAIHLEDQVAPKRCGHMAGKSVISVEEMIGKIRAAASARHDPEFVLIARTDALVIEGVDAAIDRARRYADAGADMLFVESPTSEADLEKISRQLSGYQVLLNWLEHGKTPAISYERIRQLGFAMVLFPIGSVLVTMAALREHYQSIKADGTPLHRLDGLPSFEDFTGNVGLKEIRRLEQQFR